MEGTGVGVRVGVGGIASQRPSPAHRNPGLQAAPNGQQICPLAPHGGRVGVGVGAHLLSVEELQPDQYQEVFPAGHVESIPDRQKFPLVEGDVVHPQSYGDPLMQVEQVL